MKLTTPTLNPTTLTQKKKKKKNEKQKKIPDHKKVATSTMFWAGGVSRPLQHHPQLHEVLPSSKHFMILIVFPSVQLLKT